MRRGKYKIAHPHCTTAENNVSCGIYETQWQESSLQDGAETAPRRAQDNHNIANYATHLRPSHCVLYEEEEKGEDDDQATHGLACLPQGKPWRATPRSPYSSSFMEARSLSV